MRSTVSALGVIAIAFIAAMMSSEVDSRAINQTVATNLSAVMSLVYVNDTNNETSIIDDENFTNTSLIYEDNVAELYKELLSVTVSPNDVYEPQQDPLDSDAKSVKRDTLKNKVKRADDDEDLSTLLEQVKNASSDIYFSDIGYPRYENGQLYYGPHVIRYKGDPNSTEVPSLLLLDTLKPIEDMTLEEIKAVSFHLPRAKEMAKKERENPKNATEKPLKTVTAPPFIDPRLKEYPVIPYIDNPLGRFGPFFEEGPQDTNITVRLGGTMILNCKIGMLGDKETAWVHKRPDVMTLLTLNRKTHTTNSRFMLRFKYPGNWRLQVTDVRKQDYGMYMCQILSEPLRIKRVHVVVTAPKLTIVDDYGRPMSENISVNMGDILKVKCEAVDIVESANESIIWKRDDEEITGYIRERRRTEKLGDREVLVIVNTLVLESARREHTGNYSCVVPDKAIATIPVYVISDEKNNAERVFFSRWLIILTLLCIFQINMFNMFKNAAKASTTDDT